MDTLLIPFGRANQALKTPEFEQLCDLLSGDNNSTNGIWANEVEHLCWLGANMPVGGDAVEIGSHRGKSTCCIGNGIVHSRNTTARLFAVDLWTSGSTTFDHYKSEETLEIFHKQVASLGLTDLVRPIMASSSFAATKRRKPIHLLFIDASHKYKDVLEDFRLWSPFIPVGGRIAFHDYGGRFRGVTKVVDDNIIKSGKWDNFQLYGRVFSATRIQE